MRQETPSLPDGRSPKRKRLGETRFWRRSTRRVRSCCFSSWWAEVASTAAVRLHWTAPEMRTWPEERSQVIYQQRSEIAQKAGLARSQKLSPEERKRIAGLGGKASAGIPKTKRKEQP